MSKYSPDRVLDASGLNCPMPLLKTKLEINQLKNGQVIQVVATDSGSKRDIPAFLNQVAHELLALEEVEGQYVFYIRVNH